MKQRLLIRERLLSLSSCWCIDLSADIWCSQGWFFYFVGKAPGVSGLLSRNWKFAQLLFFPEVISEHTERLYKSHLSPGDKQETSGCTSSGQFWMGEMGMINHDVVNHCQWLQWSNTFPFFWDLTVCTGCPKNWAAKQLFFLVWVAVVCKTSELVNLKEMFLKWLNRRMVWVGRILKLILSHPPAMGILMIYECCKAF